MIKRNNKKGFTIVELVIVIAVIAILAAVLIPTFSGIIKKANQSSDIQAVRQMNTAITAEFAVDKPAQDDMNAVIDALAKNGFNSKKALIPVSKDFKFAWSWADTCVVLINDKDEIVFPEGITTAVADCEILEQSVKYLDVVAKDVTTLEDALTTGNENIKLEADITLKNQVKIPAGAKVTLDLNGKTITTEQVTGRSKYLDVAGELTIVNGTIEARGIEIMDGGKLFIGEEANVTVKNVDANGGAAIWVYKGGEVEINSGTFTAMNGDNDGNPNTNAPYVVYNAGTVTINGGTFVGVTEAYMITNTTGATMTINGGDFTGNRGVINATGDGGGATVTINGGTFTVTGESSIAAHVVYAYSGSVTVNGGTFTNNGTTGQEFCEGNGSITDNRE